MKVLGIETATAVCAAAISIDRVVASEELIEQNYVHAEKLLGLIDRSMRRASVSLADLNGVAVSIGPGSFTGLRIGLSVAKGIVYGRGLPLLGVPTLEAHACATRLTKGAPAGSDILAIIDARRDDVYCQLFSPDRDRCIPVWEARDLTLPDLVRDLSDRSVTVTGDAVPKFAAFVRTHPGVRQGQFRFLDHDRARCSAGSVAVLASERLAGGAVDDPAILEPKYIKEFFLKTR